MKLRNILFGKYREKVLGNIICNEIEKLKDLNKKKKITIIDYGSGYNPEVINRVIKSLQTKHKKPTFIAYCYDYYSKEQIKKMNVNKNIKFFHINNLKQKKLNKFDFCLILDVLHHIGIDENKNEIYKITKKLKKLSKFIFIKDHFQYGFFSNLVLILMDIVGNYADNVKIPNIYFSTRTYEDFITKLKMTEINRISDKSYYKWFWFYFNSKKFQFVSILK
tara:strand:- start:837 stop:1499 length:663 start_codon:yes stop_codon:yes gene_type:complete